MENLLYLSASDALRRFQAGTLSPVALTRALLDEAKRLAPVINATTAIHESAALAAAQESEQRWRDGHARPLEGVPVAVKEETPVKGWPTTGGSLLVNEVPTESHPMIDKLQQAGAVLHIQTTVPEFCCLGQTWTKRWGVTRNPWNTDVTCGGSSGGSGASVAAGLAPLATGSDMGGSTRIPAAFQGLYGYKPPFGRLASGPGEELFAQAAEGPLARTVEDLVRMQNVIAGPHPASYNGMPYTPLPLTYDDLTGWRIAYSRHLGSKAVQREIVENMEAAIAGLRNRGALVEEVDIGWSQPEIAHTLMEGIFAVYFGEYLEQIPVADRPRLNTYIQQQMAQYCGKKNSLMNTAELASDMHRTFHAKVWSAGYRAFLCPTTFTTALSADLDPTVTPQILIEGEPIDSYLGWACTPAFNLLNRYPALSVPTGRAANGVPTGMQVVAPPYRDEVVFQVAYNHEQAGTSRLFHSEFPDYRKG